MTIYAPHHPTARRLTYPRGLPLVAGRPLALVERLQARSGSASQSFFDARGLGAAYRSAGDKNSKRAKINEALYAAERRGDVDEVLDSAELFLGGSQAQAEAASGQLDVHEGAVAVPADKRIFLSHAYADKALADLLRNTLVLGGVPEGRLFYSSDRSSGIPSGEDVGTQTFRLSAGSSAGRCRGDGRWQTFSRWSGCWCLAAGV